MQTQIKSWGNSQGVRIPKEILQETGFKENDILDILVKRDHIILQKEFRHKTLKERMDDYGGKLTLSEEVEYGTPEEGEIW